MCISNNSDLVLVQLAVLVFLLSFILKGDDDETNEDVDHEEGDDNDEDEVEDGNSRAVVLDRTLPFLM